MYKNFDEAYAAYLQLFNKIDSQNNIADKNKLFTQLSKILDDMQRHCQLPTQMDFGSTSMDLFSDLH